MTTPAFPINEISDAPRLSIESVSSRGPAGAPGFADLPAPVTGTAQPARPPARRSASVFSSPSMTRRIRMIPGEKRAQYHRNFVRAAWSVVVTRVSVRKIEPDAPAGSARSVQAIFT
jgi:hypothetical protein